MDDDYKLVFLCMYIDSSLDTISLKNNNDYSWMCQWGVIYYGQYYAQFIS